MVRQLLKEYGTIFNYFILFIRASGNNGPTTGALLLDFCKIDLFWTVF